MNVSIIGAGLSGLSCGIHLLLKGAQVKIFEKNTTAGGRASVIDEKGFRIDMGPTLVLMPEVMQGIFKAAGKNFEDYIRLVPLDPAYKVFMGDGTTFEMTTDIQKLRAQVSALAPGREKAFERYRQDVRDKFESSRSLFIERNFNSIWDMMTPASFAGALKIRPIGSAFDHAYGYFRDERLAAAFSCQTLYLGDSPFRVPSLYNLLAYLEFTYGIWYPKGGMATIPASLLKLFLDLGGTVQFNSEVSSIVVENGRASGVRLADGTFELSDAVVSNRDVPASYWNFVGETNRPSLPNQKIMKWRLGSSCYLIYLGLKKKIDSLMHHNILLSKDYRRSCRQIFEEGVLPEEPLLYVCSPTRTDPTIAPKGKEIVYVLALAPNLKGKTDWKAEEEDFKRRIFARLEEAGMGIRPEDIELQKTFTPMDFESRYGTFYGNAFGLAPNFFQSAAFRPATRSKDFKGFYHVGASTHPGTGIPMVLTSGRLVAEQVEADLAKSR